jgi:hypothetical protein
MQNRLAGSGVTVPAPHIRPNQYSTTNLEKPTTSEARHGILLDKVPVNATRREG